MKTFLAEFKTFAMRGNVIDLAVAVVIGGAFGKIVSSLVDTLIMPLIGIAVGGVNLSDLTFALGDASFRYGAFLQSVIDFIIIAFVIFIAVKAMNTLKQHEDEKQPAPVEPSEEVRLLREIRDALKR